MVKHIELWECELCNKRHESSKMAEACEAQGWYDRVPGIEVGSIVACHGFSYGWHNHPDTCWTRKNPHHVGGSDKIGDGVHTHFYQPLFAVTSIRRKEVGSHQTAYDLLCPVPPWGDIALRWNCHSTHHKMELVEPSEAILQWMEKYFEMWRGKTTNKLL